MVKLGLALLMRQREPNPELETVRARTSAPHFGTRAFGMDDAASRGHPVDVARSDGLVRSQAVAMDDLAVEEIRHRREADMRVRPNIETMSRREICGAHMIEEDERPDMTARLCGKHAAHGKAAEIARSGIDHSCDPLSRGAVRAHGVDCRKYTHALSPARLVQPRLYCCADGTAHRAISPSRPA
jgi:hypothetical protein